MMSLSSHRSRPFRIVAALALATVAASCMGGGPTPQPAPPPASTASKPRVYYAKVDGLKVYDEPSTASKVVGTLALREKVTRYRLERGYAFVESAKSGVKGWVDNARLSWKVPAVPTASAPGAASTPVEEPEPSEAEPAEPIAEAPEPPDEPATVPTEDPKTLPTPQSGPAIFNPY